MWDNIKREIMERFMTFETLKGVLLLPICAYGAYLTITDLPRAYEYTLLSLYIYGVVEGGRKIWVNRIKQAIASKRLAEKRMNRV